MIVVPTFRLFVKFSKAFFRQSGCGVERGVDFSFLDSHFTKVPAPDVEIIGQAIEIRNRAWFKGK